MGISEFGEMHRLAEMAQPDMLRHYQYQGLCSSGEPHHRSGVFEGEETESFEHLTPPDGIAVLDGDDDKLCDKKMVNGETGRCSMESDRKTKTAETEPGSKRLAEKEVYATDVEAISQALRRTEAVIRTAGAAV